jgi:hypothetical protein
MKISRPLHHPNVITVCIGFAAAIILLSAAGCGYHTGHLQRQDIRSVSVDIFENGTFRRGLEAELKRRLTEELRQHTHLRIKNEGRADSSLEGLIMEFEESAASETEDDEILLRTVAVTVSFRWVDSVTGQDLIEPVEFTEINTFALARREPVADRVFREVAETIVEKMEHPW